MKRSELLKIFEVENPSNYDEHENALEIASNLEFNKTDKTDRINYRKRAIKRCIYANVPFSSTVNICYELLESYVKVICPKHDVVCEIVHGGGSSITTSVMYRCLHGCELDITILSDGGFSFHPSIQ